METDNTTPAAWERFLEDRQRSHVEFCRLYAKNFAHGAPGHLDMILIARMADLLDSLQAQIKGQAGNE